MMPAQHDRCAAQAVLAPASCQAVGYDLLPDATSLPGMKGMSKILPLPLAKTGTEGQGCPNGHALQAEACSAPLSRSTV